MSNQVDDPTSGEEDDGGGGGRSARVSQPEPEPEPSPGPSAPSTGESEAKVVSVVCPEEVVPGDTIVVVHDGQELEHAIPEGVSAGDEFEIELDVNPSAEDTAATVQQAGTPKASETEAPEGPVGGGTATVAGSASLSPANSGVDAREKQILAPADPFDRTPKPDDSGEPHTPRNATQPEIESHPPVGAVADLGGPGVPTGGGDGDGQAADVDGPNGAPLGDDDQELVIVEPVTTEATTEANEVAAVAHELPQQESLRAASPATLRMRAFETELEEKHFQKMQAQQDQIAHLTGALEQLTQQAKSSRSPTPASGMADDQVRLLSDEVAQLKAEEESRSAQLKELKQQLEAAQSAPASAASAAADAADAADAGVGAAAEAAEFLTQELRALKDANIVQAQAAATVAKDLGTQVEKLEAEKRDLEQRLAAGGGSTGPSGGDETDDESEGGGSLLERGSVAELRQLGQELVAIDPEGSHGALAGRVGPPTDAQAPTTEGQQEDSAAASHRLDALTQELQALQAKHRAQTETLQEAIVALKAELQQKAQRIAELEASAATEAVSRQEAAAASEAEFHESLASGGDGDGGAATMSPEEELKAVKRAHRELQAGHRAELQALTAQLEGSRTAHAGLNASLQGERAAHEKAVAKQSEMEDAIFSLKSLHEQTMAACHELRVTDEQRKKELANMTEEKAAIATQAEQVEAQLEGLAHELQTKATAETAMNEALEASQRELATSKQMTASAKEWGVRADQRHKRELQEKLAENEAAHTLALEQLRRKMAADKQRLAQMDSEIARIEKTAENRAETAALQGEQAMKRAKTLEKKLGDQSQAALHDALEQVEALRKQAASARRESAASHRREVESLKREWAASFQAQLDLQTQELRAQLEDQRQALEDYRLFAKETAARERRKGMRGGPTVDHIYSIFVGNELLHDSPSPPPGGGGRGGGGRRRLRGPGSLYSSLTSASRVFTPSGSCHLSSGGGANGTGMDILLPRGIGPSNLFTSHGEFDGVLPAAASPASRLMASPRPPTQQAGGGGGMGGGGDDGGGARSKAVMAGMESPYLTKQVLKGGGVGEPHSSPRGGAATTPLNRRPRSVR